MPRVGLWSMIVAFPGHTRLLTVAFPYQNNIFLHHKRAIRGLLIYALLIRSVIPLMREGAQWLSGRVLVSRPRGRGFEPHRRHSVVVLEQDTFILA